MRRRLVVAAGVMVLLAVGAAHAGELERLREENARLRGQAASVTRPAPGPSDNTGLAAALEQRANEAVSVSPAAEPGASVVATEASRLEGLQGGRRDTGSRGAPSVRQVARAVPTRRWW
jgi:hypothetical protein